MISASLKDTETYAHLNAFSQYILNEGSLRRSITQSCDEVRCPDATRSDKCTTYFCVNTRPYSKGFASCQDITDTGKSYVVCINKSPVSAARYSGIIENDAAKLRNFYCSPDHSTSTIKADYNGWGNIVGEKCNYCNCVCKELDHYISLDPALAVVSDNRVVTGAKLSMIRGALCIQIQEGESLANGSIDSLTSG
ncbi:uncharacterized protein LOC107981585 [Nasonia vitripennis]|uniref:Uncharacterized protein n=1 Tax=Nasonia vitripennis TaxID=7425 RepID=A0A7M7TAX6_NASVI|nr:uncharacterized protein LOC107981585 [Nasonia vitripennis]XP_031788107.1 uncharacterized protein LOC107981585 [Nasonia vitripennis]